MATQSSVLAWRIPGMGEPGGLPSMGSQSWTQLKRHSSSRSYYCVETVLQSDSVLLPSSVLYLTATGKARLESKSEMS